MWQEIIQNLQNQGMTQQEIADAVGVQQGFISKLATGRCQVPNFDIGRALILLLPADEIEKYMYGDAAA